MMLSHVPADGCLHLRGMYVLLALCHRVSLLCPVRQGCWATCAACTYQVPVTQGAVLVPCVVGRLAICAACTYQVSKKAAVGMWLCSAVLFPC